jgi:peptide/bleomycin uptake transporter
VFQSFFPQPKRFFLSALIWSILCGILWYWAGARIATLIGLAPTPDAAKLGDLGYFASNDSIWFYLYYLICTVVFYAIWRMYDPHPWLAWSILGTAFIIMVTQFSVDTSVALNNWRGTFFDLIQQALTGETKGKVPAADLFKGVYDFVSIAFVWILVAVINNYFVSHWIFRWRSAMNDYYVRYWQNIRHIEGAAQRVQDDTMRFAQTMEGLFIRAIDSVLTLVAFIPVLYALSANVTELPLVGKISAPLVYAAIAWAAFGTLLMVAAGIRLPGLYFSNQRVEAAYRKELVYGEDDESRATPPNLAELFASVRKNYFKLYLNYAYFNVFRYLYLQADNIFAIILLVPTIAAGTITFGVFQQIVSAFNKVADSFQYIVNSWPTVVELQSIYKRLRALDTEIT